jgi:hypothetical protein
MHDTFHHIEWRDSMSQIRTRSNLFCILLYASAVAGAGMLVSASARAEAPATTVAYQPMVSTGLAAQNPFEVWFIFDKPSESTVPGYALPGGATIRVTFPVEFTPKPGPLGAVMLFGWSQGAIKAKFTTNMDINDPQTVVIHLDEAIAAEPPVRPGLKAFHLRTGLINPALAGDYPITLQFINAGALTGTTKAIAHITSKPVPNIAAYNQLHQGKDENWQRVKASTEANLPIDFLITLPDEARSVMSLNLTADGTLAILSDGKLIGTIKTKGVPITLRPTMFGPGYARLGIVQVNAKAGMTPGTAQIIAALDGGTEYTINLIVE